MPQEYEHGSDAPLTAALRRQPLSAGSDGDPDVTGPIGMFDSGVGGLSVARVLLRRFPREGLVYVGDTAHVPYGDRTPAELIALGDAIVAYLVTQKVRAVVVACNTSSAISLPVLRERYPQLPFIGMIEPGARAALAATRNGRIGVLATQATVHSQAYPQTLERLAAHPSRRTNVSSTAQTSTPSTSAAADAGLSQVTVVSQAAPLLVPLIEAGRVHDRETRLTLEEYLHPLMAAGVDTLILGCTHYPFVAPLIEEITRGRMTLVDPAQEVINELAWQLSLTNAHNGMVPRHSSRLHLDAARHHFATTGNPRRFAAAAHLFLGAPMPAVEPIELTTVPLSPATTATR